MKILLVGQGGREHALAWALARSAGVREVLVAPGNAGTALHGEGVRNVAASTSAEVVACAAGEGVDLVVVGPEAPLAAGLVDALEAAGIVAFGPRRAAARLEWSKAFARRLMAERCVPGPRFAVFSDLKDACAFLGSVEYDVVVKASGLAAGKGVFVPDDRRGAEAALRACLVERRFGEAGAEVVIEERLRGVELSVMALCDGARVALLPAAQDHKRALDGDRGPNTGGMGACAPTPLLTDALADALLERVFHPVLSALAQRGTPYRGALYAGLMLTDDGPRVLEFNSRLGDPEAQTVLPLLDADLAALFEATARGALDPAALRVRPGAATTVVLASEGYPGEPRRGLPIHGLSAATAQEGCLVFHAGTRLGADGALLTDGGRVLAITGLGADLKQATARAYRGAACIDFEGAHLRRDIGLSY